MREVRLRVARLDPRYRGALALLCMHHAARRRQLVEEFTDLVCFRQRRARPPCRRALRRRKRLQRLLFALGAQADEVSADEDRDHARQGAHRRSVEFLQPCRHAGRPQHPPMHHARHVHVVHIGRPGELRREVEARHAPSDHGVRRSWLRRHCARHVPRQAHARRQIPVAGAHVGAGNSDHAVVNPQLLDTDFQLARRRLQKKLPRFGADEPH